MKPRLGQHDCPNHVEKVVFMRPISRVITLTCSLLALAVAATLSACGSQSPEGKPISMPNYSPIQKYLTSISHHGENFRVFSCIAEFPVRYIIVFPGTSSNGLLLVNIGTLFPKANIIDMDEESKTWNLKELPNMDESLRHLPAAKYFVTVSDENVLRGTFDQIMSSHPRFSMYKNVTPASLILVPSRSLCTHSPPHPFAEWSHQHSGISAKKPYIAPPATRS